MWAESRGRTARRGRLHWSNAKGCAARHIAGASPCRFPWFSQPFSVADGGGRGGLRCRWMRRFYGGAGCLSPALAGRGRGRTDSTSDPLSAGMGGTSDALPGDPPGAECPSPYLRVTAGRFSLGSAQFRGQRRIRTHHSVVAVVDSRFTLGQGDHRGRFGVPVVRAADCSRGRSRRPGHCGYTYRTCCSSSVGGGSEAVDRLCRCWWPHHGPCRWSHGVVEGLDSCSSSTAAAGPGMRL